MNVSRRSFISAALVVLVFMGGCCIPEQANIEIGSKVISREMQLHPWGFKFREYICVKSPQATICGFACEDEGALK